MASRAFRPTRKVMKLLLVEGVTTLVATARELRRHGYDVVTASSCIEASGIEGDFDCAVVDPSLPDGDGIELARRMILRGRARRAVFFTMTPHGALCDRGGDAFASVARAEGVAELSRVLSPGRPRLESHVRLAALQERAHTGNGA